MANDSKANTPTSTAIPQTHNKLLHHVATAIGLLLLTGYYLLIDSTGFYDWITSQLPAKYAGSGLMLGIIVGMTPGFFLWKYYNRWVEKKLGVTGKYYEDGFYKEPEKRNNKAK